MFFQNVYKPIPLIYNLVLAMLWRHHENVELEKVKVVHYCAAVSTLQCLQYPIVYCNNLIQFVVVFVSYHNRDRSHGGTLGKKLTWRERTLSFWWQNGGIFTTMNRLISKPRTVFQSPRSWLPCPGLLLPTSLPLLLLKNKERSLKVLFKVGINTFSGFLGFCFGGLRSQKIDQCSKYLYDVFSVYLP